MKSLVVSLGGTKAARVADILAYYTKKLDSRLYVEVFDTEGNALPDANVEIKEEERLPEKTDQIIIGSPLPLSYHLEVSKDGYQPLTETITVKPERISTVQVALAKESAFYLLTTVFLTLLAPFLWALFKYAGTLLGNSPADYLSLAILVFLAQLAGAFTGLKTIGARLEKAMHNRYFSGIIGIVAGEFFAILACIFLLGYLLGVVGFIRDLFGGYALAPLDIGIITILVVILAFIGLLLDQHLLPNLNKNWIKASMAVSFGAMLGGFFSYFYLSKIARLANFLSSAQQGTDVSAFFPFIVLLFTLLWCYAIMYFMQKRDLIRDNARYYEAFLSILGVVFISVMLPILFGKENILAPFAEGSFSGAITGLIAYFLLFGGLSDTSHIRSINEGDQLLKKYRLQTTSFVVDTVRSRLESLKFISRDCFLFIDDPMRSPESFFDTDLKDSIRKKINALYRKNLENCSRLFSSIIVVIDLRNNNLCAIMPQVLEFLRQEYSIPVYAVVITTDEKLNPNWMKKIVDKADAVFPVDHEFYDDVEYLDRFFYQDGGALTNEAVYEEGCVVELINRLAPLLEIGERHSPTGLDVSHVNRILSRDRISSAPCNDVVDVIPPSDQTVASFGYFMLNAKKCQNLNLDLGMGEYIEFALRHLLWKRGKALKDTHALVIVRGKRELVKLSLVRSRLNSLYDGLLVATGDLLTESSDTLEIIILLTHIVEDIKEDPEGGSQCAESMPGVLPDNPGSFRKYWDSIIQNEWPALDDPDERYRISTSNYVNMVKKYYNRSPNVRYRAVVLARLHPGAAEWEQAKVICEWVRDSIGYVSDPVNSEYIQPPDETLNNGGGDCLSQAILLASLLMNVGFRCAFVIIPRHIYVAFYKPDAPKNVRTYGEFPWPDGTNSYDWIGFDPTCSKCAFGELPKDDLNIEEIAIIE